MQQLAYTVHAEPSIISHFSTVTRLFRDGSLASGNDDYANESMPSAEELLMRARLRSGDYIPTLATELDKLAQGLAIAQAPEAPQVERLVAELLYLDKHYTLIPRK